MFDTQSQAQAADPDALRARLLDAASAAQKNAYARYSSFHVGAALLADNGKIYAGANVENASYPEGQCAETSAIGAMVTDGGRAILEILILGSSPCTPCGGCRQRIAEFARQDARQETKVHVAGAQGILRTFRMEDLLPASFALEPVAKA